MNTKLIFLLVFIVNLAFSQDDKPVFGTDFKKYVQEMEAYYQTHDKGKGTGHKQYMRWKNNFSSKIGSEGIVKNFSKLDQIEFEKLKPKFNPNARPEATHGLWEDMGPHDSYSSDTFSGSALARITCLAFHPTNPNILWAGAPTGGLWKTTDHGGTWTCISNDFASIGITDVVVDQTNPNIIYILTGDGNTSTLNRPADIFSIGVLKTIDGGLSWKKTGLTFDVSTLSNGFCMRMHPTNHNVLLVGLDNSIAKTVDGGDNWTFPVSGTACWDIEFKPGDPLTLYAATNNGILKSTNTGSTFLPSNIGFPTDPLSPTLPRNWRRLALEVSESAPNNVYVLCGGVPAAGQFSGLYKSTDSGTSWTLRSNAPNIFGAASDGGGSGGEANGQPTYTIVLEVEPTNDLKIFTGGINCWKSDAGGATGTWSRETRWLRIVGAVDPFVHADFHVLKFRGTRLYACTDGGVYYTDDYGHSWADISSGIGATQFYNIEVDGASYIGGTQDNGSNEGNFGNLTMHNIAGGDGFGAIWNASNNEIKYLSWQDAIVRRQFGSNILINTGSGGGQFWNTILKNATDNAGILWAIQNGNALIRGNQMNDISFATWNWYNTNNTSISTMPLKGYSQGGDNANKMYAAHTDKLLKSTNVYTLPSATWAALPDPEPMLFYEDIITDPANSQKVWVVCGGYQAGKKVYKSPDGGISWTNFSGTLPNVPIMCIVRVPGAGDKFYIGTTIGVFYRSSLMTDWVYYSNGLPNVEVKDIKLNASHVFAGTYGRGIWRSELYTSCPPTLALTPANETVTNIFTPGTQVHSASVSLTSTRIYNGSVGTNINYNATNFVDLKNGFEIKKDAFLLVKNKGCPD